MLITSCLFCIDVMGFNKLFKKGGIFMRFAVYVRKSIYSEKSDSISNQQRMCQDYIEFRFPKKIDSFEIYSDEGFTGANINRPGLKRLMEDIKDGVVDALVVYQLDRLSRDVRDFSNIYSILEEHNIMFISIKENIDTNTPIGKAMMYVTMVFAQMERENIAARISDNMIGLSKKGLWTGGNPPYGYRREKIQINGKEHVTIVSVPEAAKYVEWIFDTFLENGYSLQRMETSFKRQGIKTVNGGFFSTTQLHKILTMPYCVEATQDVYDYYLNLGCQMTNSRDSWDGTYGVVIYGRSTHKNKKHELQPHSEWIVSLGIHKPFLSADKWLAVQNRLKQNNFDKKQKYDIPLLKGTLRCAKCGCLMGVSRKKKTVGVTSHYYCIKRMRQGSEVCDMRMIKCDFLDNQALDIFRKITVNPDSILQYTEVEKPKNNEVSIYKLEQRANLIRKKIKNLTETLSETAGSPATKYIVNQIEKEDLNLDALNREIELFKANEHKNKKIIKKTEDKIKEISRLITGLDCFSAKERNEIIRELINECTWDGETLFLRL